MARASGAQRRDKNTLSLWCVQEAAGESERLPKWPNGDALSGVEPLAAAPLPKGLPLVRSLSCQYFKPETRRTREEHLKKSITEVRHLEAGKRADDVSFLAEFKLCT